MNLLFRLLRVLLAALVGRRRSVLEESRLRLRVWPTDLDLNGHMNNGRYFSLMDLGRVDLMVRAGALPLLLRKHWHPMVGSEMMRFKKALRPFQSYELRTRLLGWDEKWFYIAQEFWLAGELAASALVKGLFVGPQGKISSQELLQALGLGTQSPELPEEVTSWRQLEKIRQG